MKVPPHLKKRHEQYLSGFPARLNDDLLGHWKTADGSVMVVEHHPHGYEVHFEPCYDFENCDACAPDRGPSNPHTDDGHHFRECSAHGVILTVAGGEEGHRAVLEYLAAKGSPPHVAQFQEMILSEKEEEEERLERERSEHEKLMAVEKTYEPTPAERLKALEAEIAALRDSLN